MTGEDDEAVGLSYRQLIGFAAEGAIPEARDGETRWREFSPREVFVLMVCDEMRKNFGTSVEKLSYVADFMLQKGANHLHAAITLMGDLGIAVWLVTDFDKTFIIDSELEFLDLMKVHYFGGDQEAAFVWLKVNPIVNRLLSLRREPIHLPAHGRGYEIMEEIGAQFGVRTPEEFEILQLIRSGDYDRIEITTRNGAVEVIRTTFHPETTARLTELLRAHDFQQLTVTKRDGKIVSVEQVATRKPGRSEI